MKQFEKYIFLKIGFLKIEINSKRYTECVYKIN